jgi:hypothetical protein
MTAEDRRNLELIREHMTEFTDKPSDEFCISHALRFTANDLRNKPLPRHPRSTK